MQIINILKNLIKKSKELSNDLDGVNENIDAITDELNSELYFQSGETFSLVGDYFSGGFLSNSAKTIYFDFALPKKIGDLMPTVTALNTNFRSNSGGYSIGSAYVSGGVALVGNSAYSIGARKNAENHVRITVTKTSAYNGTNNTPVGIELNALTIAFN